MSALDFKPRVATLIFVLDHLYVTDSLDSPLVRHLLLVADMAANSISYILFQAVMRGQRDSNVKIKHPHPIDHHDWHSYSDIPQLIPVPSNSLT